MEKMTQEEIDTLPKAEFAYISSELSFGEPHPYVITEKHILPDHMYLNEATIEEAERKGARCGMPSCTLKYYEHITRHVLCVTLKRDCTSKELQDYLKEIIEIVKDKNYDGFSFMETPKKFRIKN